MCLSALCILAHMIRINAWLLLPLVWLQHFPPSPIVQQVPHVPPWVKPYTPHRVTSLANHLHLVSRRLGMLDLVCGSAGGVCSHRSGASGAQLGGWSNC